LRQGVGRAANARLFEHSGLGRLVADAHFAISAPEWNEDMVVDMLKRRFPLEKDLSQENHVLAALMISGTMAAGGARSEAMDTIRSRTLMTLSVDARSMDPRRAMLLHRVTNLADQLHRIRAVPLQCIPLLPPEFCWRC